jgi:hypothetical protein
MVVQPPRRTASRSGRQARVMGRILDRSALPPCARLL